MPQDTTTGRASARPVWLAFGGWLLADHPAEEAERQNDDDQCAEEVLGTQHR
jgi:hypothetical protein